MLNRGQHLRQIAYFDICSKHTLAHDQLDRAVGILFLQSAHNFAGWIGRIADAEDQFKFRILLFGMAAEALPDLGIDTF